MLHLVIGFSALMADALGKFNKFTFSPKYTESRQNFDEDAEKFGENLEAFGYKFNADGELRHIETGERFIFDVKKGDRSFNQKHYEALGDVKSFFNQETRRQKNINGRFLNLGYYERNLRIIRNRRRIKKN